MAINPHYNGFKHPFGNTIREHINKLPSPYKELALEYEKDEVARNPKNVNSWLNWDLDVWENLMAPPSVPLLECAFNFSNTPEGKSFWKAVVRWLYRYECVPSRAPKVPISIEEYLQYRRF